MTCTRCQGLVIEDHGEWRCVQCAFRPFEKRITVKCSTADCFQLPEIHDYCTRCWHSRKRSILTDAERSLAYRARQKQAQTMNQAERTSA